MENHGLLSDSHGDSDSDWDSHPHRSRLQVLRTLPRQESSGEASDEGIDQPTRVGDRDNIGPTRGGTHIFLKNIY